MPIPADHRAVAAIPIWKSGNTNPLHIRIDIDENEIGRVVMGAEAIVSPRGQANQRVKAIFVRAEPLVTPKTSLTNSATERVDVRVFAAHLSDSDRPGLFCRAAGRCLRQSKKWRPQWREASG